MMMITAYYELFVVTYEVKRITIKKALSNSSLRFLLKGIRLAESPKTCTVPLGSLGRFPRTPAAAAWYLGQPGSGSPAALTCSLPPVMGIWIIEHPPATQGQLVLKSQVGWVCCHDSDTFFFQA